MSAYNMYLFCEGESATLCETPALKNVPIEADTVSILQLRAIFLENITEHSRLSDYDKEQIALIDSWSIEKFGQAMWDVHCLAFNKAAIIPVEDEKYIRKIGKSLGDTMEGDTSAYRACAIFAEVLEEHSEKILDFPIFDGDLFYGDME